MSGRHEKNDSREGSMLVAVPMRDMPYVCQRLISRGSRDGKAIVRPFVVLSRGQRHIASVFSSRTGRG